MNPACVSLRLLVYPVFGLVFALMCMLEPSAYALADNQSTDQLHFFIDAPEEAPRSNTDIPDISRDIPYRVRSTEYFLTELAESMNTPDNATNVNVQAIMDRLQKNPELIIGYMVGRLTDYRMILDIRRGDNNSSEQRAGVQFNFEF